MKLIYLTSKKFPSKKTDPFYVRSMAEAFAEILDENFLFLVRGGVPDEFENIPTASVNVPKRFRLFFYFFLLPALVITRKWNDKKIVFLSYDPYLLTILIFWRKILRFKYVVCSDWHQLFDDWRDAYVAKGSDYLTCTSQRLKKLLISRFGIDPRKILVAYGGVNPDPFYEKFKISKIEHRKKLGLPTDAFLVGYIGIFTSMGFEKGIGTMIAALPQLEKNITMVFVGGSIPEIDGYTRVAEKEDCADRCIFVKRQPFDKVVEYELAMDVLVIPYPDKHHFRNYGFPMKVWEYMAAGRPIVYSNLEIIREVLQERATPFEAGSPRSLADSIRFVREGNESAEKISGKNPTEVKAYTWRARAENILNFIRT